MTSEQPKRTGPWFRSGLALVAFLVISGFFIVSEHGAHLLGVLPYLLLLACLLVHFFHHGYGAEDGQHGGNDRPSAKGEGR
jgi:hypothetical protein